MPKSKLTTIGEWSVKEGTSQSTNKPYKFWSASVVFEDGTNEKLSVSGDAQKAKVIVGTEYDYEVTTNDKGYKSVKINFPQTGFGGGFKPQSPKGQVMAAALTAAATLVVGGKTGDMKTFDVAKHLYDNAMKHIGE